MTYNRMNHNIDEYRHSHLSKIKVIDNLLPAYDLEQMKEKYDFENLKENCRDGSYIGDDNISTYIGFANELEKASNDALFKIGYNGIETVQTNVVIVSDINSNFQSSRHFDDTCSIQYGYTLSYHWMGDENAGGTSFFTDFYQKTPIINIPFKPNRLVVFPALIPHEGYANPGYSCNSKRVIMTLFSVLKPFEIYLNGSSFQNEQ